mmetsp:Transcript_5586/g.10473  ORF Transcript_5586/g.10473 Transcript_5586/m.10473 type:complete len:224 (-) Transcript_5586:3520-4191(-)
MYVWRYGSMFGRVEGWSGGRVEQAQRKRPSCRLARERPPPTDARQLHRSRPGLDENLVEGHVGRRTHGVEHCPGDVIRVQPARPVAARLRELGVGLGVGGVLRELCLAVSGLDSEHTNAALRHLPADAPQERLNIVFRCRIRRQAWKYGTARVTRGSHKDARLALYHTWHHRTNAVQQALAVDVQLLRPGVLQPARYLGVVHYASVTHVNVHRTKRRLCGSHK